MSSENLVPSISYIFDENFDWFPFPDGLHKTAFGSVMRNLYNGSLGDKNDRLLSLGG
jgi:hypothetical protein